MAVWKKELRVVPSNDLRRNINASFMKIVFLILYPLYRELFKAKFSSGGTLKVSVLWMSGL